MSDFCVSEICLDKCSHQNLFVYSTVMTCAYTHIWFLLHFLNNGDVLWHCLTFFSYQN